MVSRRGNPGLGRPVHEITLNVHPVLLGSGVPLFHGLNRQIDLELLDCQPFQNGCIYASYGLLP